jgi:vancomycin resistance protein VanJ
MNSTKPLSLSKKVFRALSRFSLAAANIYGLSISTVLLLRMVFGERWSVMGFFDSFAHLLMMPALAFFFIALLIRRRWTALMQIVPALVFLESYGSFFLAHPVRAAPNVPQLSVLTYNLNKNNQAIEAVVANVNAIAPDVAAFQELSPAMAAGLQTRLGDQYPYIALHPDPQNAFRGMGVLSRYPILADTYFDIGLGHQRVELDVHGVKIALHNTHPMHPLCGLCYDGAPRASAIGAVLEQTTTDTLPLLLIGDFNMTDQTGDYRRVSDHYHDSYREVGWGMGFTFPDFKTLLGINFVPPLARIDYIFHTDDFRPIEARVWPDSGGSDHRPVYAVLALAHS